MDVRAIITSVLLGLGCFFIVISSIGLIRFPDFYTRIHPAGKSDTLGQTLVLLGLAVYEGFSLESIKLMLIVLFVFIANPTATHALAKAAYLAGVPFWVKGSHQGSRSSGTLQEAGDGFSPEGKGGYDDD